MLYGFRTLRKVQLAPKLEKLFLKIGARLHFCRSCVLTVELVQCVLSRFYAVVLLQDFGELVLWRCQRIIEYARKFHKQVVIHIRKRSPVSVHPKLPPRLVALLAC